MKKAGIVLLCLQGLALIGSIAEGNLSAMFSSGAVGFFKLIGFFLPAIIGIILLVKASSPKTAEKKTDAPAKESKKNPKKTSNILIILAVALGAFVIGKFVIAPSMVSDSDKDTGTTTSQTQQTENNSSTSATESNPEYDEIFDGKFIMHFQTFFTEEMAHFAKKMDDGTIHCVDYGYKDDVVEQWTETQYISVSQYTDEQRTELENAAKKQYAELDALNCCAVTYEMNEAYFTITIAFSDVTSNYSEMYSAGLLAANTVPSMSATEDVLLKNGYVKK